MCSLSDALARNDKSSSAGPNHVLNGRIKHPSTMLDMFKSPQIVDVA